MQVGALALLCTETPRILPVTDHVKPVPCVHEEGPEQIRGHVEEQLRGEEGGEDDISNVEEARGGIRHL